MRPCALALHSEYDAETHVLQIGKSVYVCDAHPPIGCFVAVVAAGWVVAGVGFALMLVFCSKWRRSGATAAVDRRSAMMPV